MDALEERRLRYGVGVPIGMTDAKGKPVHIGDVLFFDEREWGAPFRFSPWIKEGELVNADVLTIGKAGGTAGDIRSWCEVIHRWDSAEAASAQLSLIAASER